MSKTALIIGGSRGLGCALVKELVSRGYSVVTTVRNRGDEKLLASVKIIEGIELSEDGFWTKLEAGIGSTKFDLVIFSAGFFPKDDISTLSWADHIKTYSIVAMAPTFVASSLYKLDAIKFGGKFINVTTEGGSIALRTIDEGGGNYIHHASKAAQNMVGKLLSIDFHKKEVAVINIHPGFMRTEMTKNIGYDQYWDSGGAVEAAEAATSLVDFALNATMEDSGKFWAPRGPLDIGQAEPIMGKNLPTPLELPW